MLPTFLRIAVKPFRYSIEIQTNSSKGLEIRGGYDGLLIKDLAKAIGFDYEIHIPEDNAFGARHGDNWTGLLGMLDTGTVDMAAPMMFITEDRYSSFTQIPFLVLQYTFVTNRPGFRQGDSKLQYPFQSEVWYAWIAAYVLTTLMLWVLSGRRLSIPIQATKALGMILGKDSIKGRISTATNIVSSCWVLSSMFLVFGYSAVLLSSLTLPVREKGIRTIDELVDAVLNSDQKAFLVKGSAAVFEQLAHDPKLREFTRKINDSDWYFQRYNDARSRLGHKSAHLGNRLVLEMDHGIKPFATKFISEDAFYVSNVGVVVGKSFCCTQKLRRYMNRIREAGLYESYVRQTRMKSASDRPLELEESPVKPLSLANLRGIFFLLMVGLFSAFILFLIEILYSKINK